MITSWIKAKDGREYPVIFNNAVVMKLQEAENITVDESETFLMNIRKWPMQRVRKMYYFMMKVGGIMENKPFDITDDEFSDWLYITNQDLINQLLKAFVDGIPNVVTVPDEKKTKPKVKG